MIFRGQQDDNSLIVDSTGMIIQEITLEQPKIEQVTSLVIQSTENYQIIREN